MFGVWEPGDNREMLLDGFKRRCEQFATLGLTRIYTPSAATQRYSAEDYKAGPDRMRAVGDIGLDRDPADFGGDALDLVLRTGRNGDLHPGGCELERDVAPDSAPTPGDERDLALKLAHAGMVIPRKDFRGSTDGAVFGLGQPGHRRPRWRRSAS